MSAPAFAWMAETSEGFAGVVAALGRHQVGRVPQQSHGSPSNLWRHCLLGVSSTSDGPLRKHMSDDVLPQRSVGDQDLPTAATALRTAAPPSAAGGYAYASSRTAGRASCPRAVPARLLLMPRQAAGAP